MLFDFAALDAAARYRLLASAVVPRPIAWVVSMDQAGRVNAAPFSFFNVFGDDPPVVGIGIGGRDGEQRHKDTGANIRATGQFVVNLVPFAQMQAMHVTAVDFPREVDELEAAGLATLPSARVAPPRIAASPVAMECERHEIVELGNFRTLVIGRVLAMHVDDAAVRDAATQRLDPEKLDLVGRVWGAGGYLRTAGPGLFTRARLTLAEWRAQRR